MVVQDLTQGQTAPERFADLDGLITRLSLEYAAQPVDDGYIHPADAIVEENLRLFLQTTPGDLLETLAGPDPQLQSSVVKSLARCAKPWTSGPDVPQGAVNEDSFTDTWHASNWRYGLIDIALRTGNILLRDAAVQAVEEWEDSSLAPLLRSHQEREAVPWLRSYVSDVISDLSP